MLDQLEVDVTKLLNDKQEESIEAITFKAEIEESIDTDGKTAILQVNIAQRGTCEDQLASALKLLSKKFSNIKIFIDMQLALLVYSIILPYMAEEQLQNIVMRRKLDWIQKNMPIIKQATIPCSILAEENPAIIPMENNDNQLLRSGSKLRKNLLADTETLKDYLFDTHSLTNAQYQQFQYKNDKALELYLMTRLAHLQSTHTNNIYIALHKMSTYSSSPTPNIPQHLTLTFTKTTSTHKKPLPTSSELNQNLQGLDLLGKITERRSYLEEAIRNFHGNVYLQSSKQTILACNKQQGVALGVTDESFLIGKTPAELLIKKDADEASKVLKDIITKNETAILIEDYPLSGERIPYITIKTPLRNKKNKIIGIIGFSKQITDEKEIESVKQLESEDIMQTIISKEMSADILSCDANTSPIDDIKSIIEQMPGHVFWQGLDGSILGCNYNHALCFGHEVPKGMVGKALEDFLDGKDVGEAEKDIKSIAATGNPMVRKETYKTLGGPLEMISHKTPIRDGEDNVIGVMVVAIDVSANKQREIIIAKEKEQLALATKRKNHFISTMENDIKDSFDELHKMTMSYAMEETDETKRQQMHEIADCAKDLVRFSKNIGDADYKDLVSVKSLVEDIVAENSASLGARRLDVVIDYDDSIPDTILASEYKLRGKLFGLIMEAVSQSVQSTLTIVVKLESHSTGEIAISFAIPELTGKNQQVYIFKQQHAEDIIHDFK